MGIRVKLLLPMVLCALLFIFISSVYAIDFILVALFLSLLVAVVFVQEVFVRRPLISLRKSVNLIAYGDSEAAVPDTDDDELGELADSIKMMRNNMAAFQKSLKEKTVKANDLAVSLYESQYRMQSILENLAHGVVVADEDGTIESVNRSLCEMLGYDEAELTGHNISLLVPEKFRNSHLHGMRRFLEKGISTIIGKGGIELEALTKSGELLPVDIAITSMTIGEKRYFNAVLSDVSERKSAEVRLRQESERTQHYLQTVEVIVVALDCHGNISLINRKGLELSGYSENEMVGKPWDELCVLPQERDKFRDFLAKQLRQESDFTDSSESLIFGKDKSGRLISWRYSLLVDDKGQVTGLLCSGTDITAAREAEQERENMQQQLQQSQKMQAIGQLTGGIAHDFNNIIASILGHAELLMARIGDNTDVKVAKYLENIYRSGERAKDLVEKMLAFSRGRGKDLPAAIEVDPAVSEIINILRSVLPATIDIKVSPAGKAVAVLAAPIDLQQIIMNLCINARDAMNGQGEIVIDVSTAESLPAHICSSCHQDFEGDFVCISVTDNGSGIPEGQIDRLFEPFFTTKEVGKGTGMGLSVVHGIVHDLGGHITVTSTVGIGTCFCVYLKSTRAAVSNERCADGVCDLQIGSGRVVLLVDDEPLVREFVSELLNENGYTVLLASDPFEALDVVKSRSREIDVIITDQSMPGMTGVQMASIISNMFLAIPIILSTGYGENLSEADLREAGIQFMLTKPMKGQMLLSALANILEQGDAKATSLAS